MENDQREALRLLAGISAIVILLGGLLVFIGPEAYSILSGLNEAVEPGLGLKDAAILSFVLTVVLLLVFAIFAGDGLLGEIQFMIGGFGGFFIFFWIMLAWIF